MKLRVLVLLASSACTKPDNSAAIRSEAAEIAPYYQAQVERLDARIQDIQRRGIKLTQRLPGSDAAGAVYAQVTRDLAQLHTRLAELPKKLSAATSTADMQRVADQARDDLEELTTQISGELTVDQTWIGRAEAQMAALPSGAILSP